MVEGSAKRGAREYRRFLDITIGSLAELGYAFRVARELEMLSRSDWDTLEDLRRRAGFLTWRLYQSLRNGGR
jgi:four helix bundle protein